MTLSITGFLICAGIIFFAGKRLSYYGDMLSDLTGMGKAWIGLILMSAITTLPELMVGISAAAIVQSADLAVGDILGSCAFNLGILSLMDIFTPRSRPLFSSTSKSHILAAAFGVILVALAGLGLFFDEDIVLAPSIGMTSITFAIIYFVSIKTIYRYQKRYPTVGADMPAGLANLTLRQVVRRYIFFASIIIVVALALPYFGEQIADATGLQESFVGTLFLAGATSLPEIAISISAVRMGSAEMAVGNLLGSNIFNIFILFLIDIFYLQGHLLKDASDANLVSVFFVILMAATAIIGFIFPSKEKRIFMAWDALAIFLLYVVNMVLLYKIS
jgi:cation:H+ antiporter